MTGTFRDFFTNFPDEESCKKHFKAYRDKAGVICKKCQCKDHYWLSTIWYYKCKGCGFRTSLKSGSVMENSKLPFSYWYMAFMLVSSSKKSFSALEIQRQLKHKRYQPIWEMMHKIRIVMGKRDSEYQLHDTIEMDEGMFIGVPEQQKDINGNNIPRQERWRGKNNPRSQQVLVMTESKYNPNNKNKHRANRAVKYIKMICIDDNKGETILHQAQISVDKKASVYTDGAWHYNRLKGVFAFHHGAKVPRKQGDKVLPWVHKSISNAKRNLLGVHHSIGRPYMQNYLNEFCFKFNRRYEGIDLFDRVINAMVKYEWD